MNFCALGTCVSGDIINLARKRGYDWKLVKNIVSFSPLAIVDWYGKQSKKLPAEIFSAEPANAQANLLADINGDILCELKKSGAEYLLVNISDFRMGEKIYTLKDGTNIYATDKRLADETKEKISAAIEQVYQSKIVSEATKTAAKITDDELAVYVNRFIEILKENFGGKVIIYQDRPVTHYKEDGEIKRFENINYIASVNLIVDRCINTIDGGGVLPFPEKVIGDASCLSVFSYHYSDPYYSYITEAIENIVSGKEWDIAELLGRYQAKQKEVYIPVFIEKIVKANKKLLSETPDSDLVVLTSDEYVFAEFCRQTGRSLQKIDYNENTDMDELKTTLVKYLSEHPKVKFIAPETFRWKDISLRQVLFEAGYFNNADLIVTPFEKFNLSKFTGKYKDIYNNEFFAESPINISVLGAGIKLYVGSDCKITSLLHVNENAKLSIGKSSTVKCSGFTIGYGGVVSIGDRALICDDSMLRAHSFHKIEFGTDCMFSYRVIIFAGDGHSIFKLTDKEHKEYVRTNCGDEDIVIGDHVWGGIRSTIFSGANIGSGSIIASGAFVSKKKYPNNCIIAGVPAKVIKRDVAWSRKSMLTDLMADCAVFESYANQTDDGTD